MSSKPAPARICSNSLTGQRAGDATGVRLHVRSGGVVHVVVGDDVGDGEAAAGAENAGGFGDHLGLVAGEVDHAVGDDHVDGACWERDLFDVAAQPLHVLDSGFELVLAGQGEHLVCHVQTVGEAGLADALG